MKDTDTDTDTNGDHGGDHGGDTSGRRTRTAANTFGDTSPMPRSDEPDGLTAAASPLRGNTAQQWLTQAIGGKMWLVGQKKLQKVCIDGKKCLPSQPEPGKPLLDRSETVWKKKSMKMQREGSRD